MPEIARSAATEGDVLQSRALRSLPLAAYGPPERHPERTHNPPFADDRGSMGIDRLCALRLMLGA